MTTKAIFVLVAALSLSAQAPAQDITVASKIGTEATIHSFGSTALVPKVGDPVATTYVTYVVHDSPKESRTGRFRHQATCQSCSDGNLCGGLLDIVDDKTGLAGQPEVWIAGGRRFSDDIGHAICLVAFKQVPRQIPQNGGL